MSVNLKAGEESSSQEMLQKWRGVREYKENAGRNVNKEGQEGLILNSGRFHISRGRGQRGERAEQRE
jgi:hypothetical protein